MQQHAMCNTTTTVSIMICWWMGPQGRQLLAANHEPTCLALSGKHGAATVVIPCTNQHVLDYPSSHINQLARHRVSRPALSPHYTIHDPPHMAPSSTPRLSAQLRYSSSPTTDSGHCQVCQCYITDMIHYYHSDYCGAMHVRSVTQRHGEDRPEHRYHPTPHGLRARPALQVMISFFSRLDGYQGA